MGGRRCRGGGGVGVGCRGGLRGFASVWGGREVGGSAGDCARYLVKSPFDQPR